MSAQSASEVDIRRMNHRLFTGNPSRGNVPVLAVNTPESKNITLENRSECDVTYKLLYVLKRGPSRCPSHLHGGSGFFWGDHSVWTEFT